MTVRAPGVRATGLSDAGVLPLEPLGPIGSSLAGSSADSEVRLVGLVAFGILSAGVNVVRLIGIAERKPVVTFA